MKSPGELKRKHDRPSHDFCSASCSCRRRMQSCRISAICAWKISNVSGGGKWHDFSYGQTMPNYAKIQGFQLGKKIRFRMVCWTHWRTGFIWSMIQSSSLFFLSVRTWKTGMGMYRDGDAMAAPFWAVLGRIFKIKWHTPGPQKNGLSESELETHPRYVGKSIKQIGMPSSRRKLT